MTTEENNKLIAQFMGADINPRGTGLYPHSIDSGITRVSIPFMYHRRLDWLMPVLEKISSLGYYFEINNQGVHWSGDKECSKFICSIYQNKHRTDRFPEISRNFGDSIQTATYKAVASFINKRNKQKGNEDFIKSSL